MALMCTLEETRCENEAIKKERDHYKEFWQAMNTYHSVMSRFQLPTGSIPAAPFPSQVQYPNPAPHDLTPDFPMYSSGTSSSTLQAAPPSLQDSTPIVPLDSVSPVNATAIPQPQIHALSLQSNPQVPPSSIVNSTPETPKKKSQDKPIESYFGTSKSPEKTAVSRSVGKDSVLGGGTHRTELPEIASNKANDKKIDTPNMFKDLSPDPEAESLTIEDVSKGQSHDTEAERSGLSEKDERNDEMDFFV